MIPKRTARCLGAAAVVALAVAACSKDSTGPGDTFAGSWNVTIQRRVYNGDSPPDTGTVTPAPFTLTIAKSGQAYTASWPVLTWNVTVQSYGAVQEAFPGSATAAGTVTTSGDTLAIQIPQSSVGSNCVVEILGTFTGNTATGGVHIVGGSCGTLGGPEAATGSWTATKG